jgi:hypothetical protein
LIPGVFHLSAFRKIPIYTTRAITFDDGIFDSLEKEADILDHWGFVEYGGHDLV